MKLSRRNYNCKDEELTVIAGFILFALKRDLKDFSAFSPLINAEYVSVFENLLNKASGLVRTFSAYTKSKTATAQLYDRMDNVMTQLNKLNTYINLAGLEESAFGISTARRKLSSRDAEGLIQQLKIVNDAVNDNKEALMVQGFSEEQVELLLSTSDAIAAGNQQQYEAGEERKALVVENRKVLGQLHRHITDICRIGKTLYQSDNPLKVREYTFRHLVNQVRAAALKK
jgi:hypothetical protein